ncbi:MAG: alpha-mannosidase [Chloroflexi bacterium]|nr:alpha-mannosidase [Chloroflexota bacterium]
MMVFTHEKLKLRSDEIIAAAVYDCELIAPVFMAAAADGRTGHMLPPEHAWSEIHRGDTWGQAGEGQDLPEERPNGYAQPVGHNYWLRTAPHIPSDWQGQSVLLKLERAETTDPCIEALVYWDGQPYAGLDQYHSYVRLPATAGDGADHDLLVRCYLPTAQPFKGLYLQRCDDMVLRLGWLLRAMVEAVHTYPDTAVERHRLLVGLNTLYAALDLRHGWNSDAFRQSASLALAKLEQLVATLAPINELDDQPRLVATGHSHLDVAWLWPLWRTRQKAAHSTATALYLMDRFPNYHFSMSQPQVLSFIKEDEPALYQRLKQRVSEGRFEPVGLMWLEPDCNIPSGESLVRQLLHGARFLQEEFDSFPRVAWLPDTFGFSAALPQLLRSCGIDSLMTTKISWNQFNKLPYDTFRWRGIDGSDVLAHFVTASEGAALWGATYNGKMTAHEIASSWQNYRHKELNTELLYIYGWGDGGGGPTEEMLEVAQLFGSLPGFPQVCQGRVDQYFDRLTQRIGNDARLPVWVGELYMEYHQGTYTSQAHTKQANRAAELLYREVEWLNAWAVTTGAPNQQAHLDDGWQLILLNQFHDILPGSSIGAVYADSATQYEEVQRIGQTVREVALSHLVHTDQAQDLLVFNSLPWARHDVLKLPLVAAGALLAENTTAPHVQIIEEESTPTVLVDVHTPSYGYRAVTLDETPPDLGHLAATPEQLENDFVRVVFDDQGEIASLVDRRHQRELVAPAATLNQLVLYEDRPLDFDAWNIDAFYIEKAYPVQTLDSWTVVERGPVRAAVEVVRTVGASTIRQRICLWHHSPRIDFITEVDWHERQMLLRALFPLHLNASTATCEIQFGAIERPTHQNTSWDWARFEVPAHRWVDLSEGDYGVALLNDGKYGHSLAHNVLGLSLLKSAIDPDPDADQGMHRFTYSLLPHRGDWRSGEVVRRAYELNAPLTAVWGKGAGSARERSFLATPTDHIVVETVKVATDGDGLIVRCYEAHNQRGITSLVFDQPVHSAELVNLLEEPTGEQVTVDGQTLTFEISPYEVKTLRVRLYA